MKDEDLLFEDGAERQSAEAFREEVEDLAVILGFDLSFKTIHFVDLSVSLRERVVVTGDSWLPRKRKKESGLTSL